MESYLIEKQKLKNEYREIFEKVETYAAVRCVEGEIREEMLMNPYGEGLNFQSNHLYTAYWSAVNFQPDHLYTTYRSVVNFLCAFILTRGNRKVNKLSYKNYMLNVGI